ncbi:WAS/WASL-interacting protein family member 3-like [Equus caballus]|uniref:WAS/WASL-interacting protein family member 3-like n=1 Tax=Equus caballus TaxID=9796 RepID=UPI0038B2CAAF
MPSVSPWGSRKEMGCPQEKAKPLPPPPLLPSPPRGSSSARLGAAGESQPSFPCLRVLPLAPGAREMPGGRNSNQEGKGGGSRGEDTYPALSLSGKKKKKITKGRGGKSEERRMLKEKGARRGRWSCRCHCGQALPSPLGSVTQRGFQSLAAHMEGPCLRGARSPAAGTRTASARRGAGQHLPARSSSTSGRRSRDWRRRRRRQQRLRSRAAREAGKPCLLLPAPVPSSAPPSPPPYRTPRAVRTLLPCPRLVWKPKGDGPDGPGSISWGGGRGRRRAPLPRREAVLKLGICSVILEPRSHPGRPPPRCRKPNPSARMPSLSFSPPLQIEMVQAPGAPAPREPQSGVREAGLPSGPNTKGRSPTSRLERRGLQKPLMQMFSMCN